MLLSPFRAPLATFFLLILTVSLAQADPFTQGVSWRQTSGDEIQNMQPGDSFGRALTFGDFNGDGYADLAVGVKESPGDAEHSGGVQIFYGPNQHYGEDFPVELWTQDSPGVTGRPEDADDFGYALAAGDFDGNGCDDLAIGIPGEDIGDVVDAGAVSVLYGSSGGLSVGWKEFWTQDDLLGTIEEGDAFGQALVAGDFNGDGYDDLTVGSPYVDVSTGGEISNDAGMAHVIFGSDSGLSTETTETFAGGMEADHRLGAVLGAGDFDGDGTDDLVLGLPRAAVNDMPMAGKIMVLTGADAFPERTVVYTQGAPDSQDPAAPYDLFGAVLACGDFNGDGYEDLAVGTPDEDVEGAADGAVHILYGSYESLVWTGNQFLTQGKDGLIDLPETADLFGKALATGDFDGDGYDDLAIGVPGEELLGEDNAGVVHVAFGSAEGVVGDMSLFLNQHLNLLFSGRAEAYDTFGGTLAAGDFDRDGRADLAVGVSGEDLDGVENAGYVQGLLTGKSRLVFPYVACNEGWATEVCVVNRLQEELSGRLRCYDAGGTLLESLEVSLPSLGRAQYAISQVFPFTAAETRYCVFESGSDQVAGYTKFSLAQVMRGAVPAVGRFPSGQVLMPHLGYNDPWWTGLGLVNLPRLRRPVQITFNTRDQATLTLEEQGQASFTVHSLFEYPPVGVQSAVMDASPGLLALELFGSGTMLAGVGLSDETSATLYYPHVAPSAGMWWTGLVAYNPGGSDNDLTITAYSETGTVLDTMTDTLEPGGKLINSVQGLGLPPTTAWVKIEGTHPLTGLELFGTADNKQLAGYSVVNFSRTSGVLPKIDSQGWTGISLVNTTDDEVSVSMIARNDQGIPMAAATIELPPHAKILGTPGDLFAPMNPAGATYVHFSADGPVAAFQLNGSSDGMMLDALPAQ